MLVLLCCYTVIKDKTKSHIWQIKIGARRGTDGGRGKVMPLGLIPSLFVDEDS
jgi:CO dehydrogenase/acetyl-CoA synthase delta subunit